MIRINLLKQPAKKKSKKLKLSPKFFIIVGITSGVLLVSAGGWWGFKKLYLFLPEGKQKVVVKDDFTPSTFVSAYNVEEVVRDVNDSKDKLKRRGVLDLPYEQLSFVEKINYEIHFAKNVCDLLTRTVIPGVDFKNIQVSSFKTFKGVGVSNSKENLIKVFKLLKKEKVEILPKPQTVIRKSNNGYQFTISCITEFGLNLEAPFLLGPDDVLEYEEVDMVLKKIVNIAEDDGVNITSGPFRLKAFFVGDYRRFRYRLSGTSSYSNFVAFINNLYERHVPCAFEEFKLTALSENSLKIEADIIFTTSN